MEGLPDQRPRPAQDHDARRRRVHPPLSPARAAKRLPSHPPLRPVRRNGSSAQHRARPPTACCVRGLAPKRARRGRQRDRNTFACAPMPVLRRPDDHHRDVRRSAPRALPLANPDQDRHLMIIAALPASNRLSPSPHPPAGAGGRRPLEVVSPPPTAAPAPGPRILATELARHHRFRRQDSAPPAPAATHARRPRS